MRLLIPACLSPPFRLCSPCQTAACAAAPSHAIAMHGEPALPADFDHFPYANPDAPKGGQHRLCRGRHFDSLNPFIVQGDARARHVRRDVRQQRLRDADAALARRGRSRSIRCLPRSIDTDADRTYVEFTLDPRAKFSDGTPVTPDDVIFSLRAAARQGPAALQALDRRGRQDGEGRRARRAASPSTTRPTANCRCSSPCCRSCPSMPSTPTNFDKSTLKPMIGFGPYRIDERHGRARVVVLKRNPDYWAKDIPSKRGFDNYDEIRIELLPRRQHHVRGLQERRARHPPRRPTPAAGRAATTSRPPPTAASSRTPSRAASRRACTASCSTRAAPCSRIATCGWRWPACSTSNGPTRTCSTAPTSAPAAIMTAPSCPRSATPASDAEKALLAPLRRQVLPEIMAGTWQPPVVGRQRPRPRLPEEGLRCAEKGRLRAQDGTMVGPDGKPLTFEILLNGKAGEARSPAPGSARWRSSASLSPSAPSTAPSICSASASSISTPC